MFPKLAELAAVVGLLRLVWLRTLKNSAWKLEAEAFAWAEGEVLQGADVPADEGRAVECSLAGVAVGAEREAGVGVIGDERRRIEIVDACRGDLSAGRASVDIGGYLHRAVGVEAGL